MPLDDGMCRHMDLILYVLYSRDECFVHDMVERVAREVVQEYQSPLLLELLKYTDRPILFRCLFFLLLNFHTKFRYWVLSEEASTANGLPPISPPKMCRFLIHLRDIIVPGFLVDEVLNSFRPRCRLLHFPKVAPWRAGAHYGGLRAQRKDGVHRVVSVP